MYIYTALVAIHTNQKWLTCTELETQREDSGSRKAENQKEVATQAILTENTRRDKNGPCRIKCVGNRRTMWGNVAAKWDDACLLFGEPLMAHTDPY